MSYVEKVLQPDEKIIMIGRKHWIIYGWSIVVLILAILVAFLAPVYLGYPLVFQIIGGVLAALAVVTAFRAWFDQWTTEIAVTNRRLIYKRGFISRYTTEMNMEKIESVVVDQNLFGRLLGYGTISARGTGVGIEHLTLINDPLALRSAITVR